MPSASRSRRHRTRLAAVAIAVAVAAGACSSDGVGDAGESAGTTDAGPSTAEREFTQAELDCVAGGYACSWSEAEPGAAERTDDILAIASALAGTGETAEEIAAAIDKAPDIASLAFDDFGVMFRVTGGVPAFVDVDPTGSGTLLAAGSARPKGAVLPSLAAAGAFTGCPGGGAAGDPDGGVTRAAGDGKHALLLSPWQFGLPWDVATLRDNLRLTGSRYTPEYGGSVTTKQTPAPGQSITFPSGSNVVPSDFCGWDAYDTIVLMTHGRALCSGSDQAGAPTDCSTSFSVGQFAESEAETRALVGSAVGVSVGVGNYGDLLSTLTREEKDACIAALEDVVYDEAVTVACFERLPDPTVSVKVTTDFFRANYPNGLPDRLIFLAACQGMKFGDMGTALGTIEGSGQILGFSQIAVLADAQRLLEEFTERLGEKDRIGDDFKAWANDLLDARGAEADLYDFTLSDLPGGELGDLDTGGPTTWGSDVVSIASGGEELVDGSEVMRAPSAGGGDNLLVTLLLSDVVAGETPEQYGVEVLFDDQLLDIGSPAWRPASDDDMEAEVVLRLPRDLEEETFDLEIRGVLPGADNAPTTWKFTDLIAKVGTACDVLADRDVSDALDVDLARIPAGDQGFLGDFCGWVDAADSSQLTLLVTQGAAEGFRAGFEDSDLAVDGFGDVAIYDAETGRGSDCSSIRDNQTGEVQWVCFVNLNVAVGEDVLYFTLSGNVVGENGPEASLALLRDLVDRLRDALRPGQDP